MASTNQPTNGPGAEIPAINDDNGPKFPQQESVENWPFTTPEEELQMYYKLLLLIFEDNLQGHRIEFKAWAARIMILDPMNIPNDIKKIFCHLEQKGLINYSNLTNLMSFSKWIDRYDLLYYVNCFLSKEYKPLSKHLINRGNSPNLPKMNPRREELSSSRTSLQGTIAEFVDTNDAKESVDETIPVTTNRAQAMASDAGLCCFCKQILNGPRTSWELFPCGDKIHRACLEVWYRRVEDRHFAV